MSLQLTILGCHSATPRTFAHPTSQYLEINDRSFLIDCGEGTQVQLRKYKIKFSKIDNIFISHLHGDHFFGLIGLISTFGLLNRQKDLHIYAPKGIKEIIELQLKLSKSYIQFDIVFHELEKNESQLIYEDDKVEVHTIPLDHRIYTNGFLFKEKLGERKLNIEAVKENPQIEICDYQNLKNGRDFVLEDGTVIDNAQLTFNPPNPVSYAYCSDTMYKPAITSLIEGVDLLYHESTFLKDREDLTGTTKHSTAEQAGLIAQKANVGLLILGHYSSRYDDISLFKSEAESVFNHVALAEEGKIFNVSNKLSPELQLVQQN